MSETPQNRLPANGTVKPEMGGIDLGLHLVRNRVGEIITARLAEPLPAMPECVEEIVVVQPDSNAKNVNVDFVRRYAESKMWSLIRDVRGLGGDERDGDFTLDEGVLGKTVDKGLPCVRFMLTWKPRAASGSKPLAIVQE